jgi:hypothetical protein
MIRAFQIVVESEDRDQRSESRISGFCILALVFCLLAGCVEPEKEPIWEKVQIGDLAPYDGDKTQRPKLLDTINFDIHIFEVPAENIDKVEKISKRLHVRPLRLKNYRAFDSDSFSVRFGQFPMWDEIHEMMLAANGQKIAKVSLLLSDGQPETIAITGLDHPRTIFYTSIDGSREGANVGPGVLGLRIKALKIPGSRGVCKVSAYPALSLPVGSSILQLNTRVKLREFGFTAAAFGLKMSPGDFVLLAPKEYISDQTALGGLFFSNPQGSLFFSKRKPPEHKPAVRVFLLVCTSINY